MQKMAKNDEKLELGLDPQKSQNFGVFDPKIPEFLGSDFWIGFWSILESVFVNRWPLNGLKSGPKRSQKVVQKGSKRGKNRDFWGIFLSSYSGKGTFTAFSSKTRFLAQNRRPIFDFFFFPKFIKNLWGKSVGAPKFDILVKNG